MGCRFRKIDTLYPAFRFFQDLALIYPVYTIMFRLSGLDYLQIGGLLALWAGTVALLEVPSGMLADLWRRDLTLGLALSSKALGFLVWWLWPGFPGFAAGFVLWGIQEALVSGTADALLYDTLQTEGRAGAFEKIAGRGALFSRAGIVISIAAGGWVFSHNPDLVFLLSVLAMVAAAALALLLGDSRPEVAGSGKEAPPLKLATVIRNAVAVPGIPGLVLFGALTTVLYGVLDEFDFLFARHRSVPLPWLGVWGIARFGLEGVGAALAGRLVPATQPVGRTVTRRMMTLSLVGGIALFLGTVFQKPWLLALYFLYYGIMAAVEVLYHGQIQRRIPADARATVSSAVSSVYTVLGMVLGLLLGFLADLFGLAVIFPIAAVITVVAAVVYVPSARGTR